MGNSIVVYCVERFSCCYGDKPAKKIKSTIWMKFIMWFVVLFNLNNSSQAYNSGGNLIIMFYYVVQDNHDYIPIYN